MSTPQNRKWRLALWGMALGTAIAAVAIVGWICGHDGAPGILGQGLGLITLVLGMYSAANVANKRVVRDSGVGHNSGGENE